MAKGYDVTTAADNRNTILGPACGYWRQVPAARETGPETPCGLCRQCVKHRDDIKRRDEKWAALWKAATR